MDERTQHIQDWMKALDDRGKMAFALNWKIPHTLFNVASKWYKGDPDDLQRVNWFQIFKAQDMGTFENGNPVRLNYAQITTQETP